MRTTLGAFVLAMLLTVSVGAGTMQNDSPTTPPPAPTPESSQVVDEPSDYSVMQNDETEGLTAEVVLNVLLGVLALS